MGEYVMNSAEDLLIDSFQFKVPPGASYVTDRRSVSYFTAGSNIYQSGSGTKIIRINITGDGWLDPSTVRLHYTLVNNSSVTNARLRTIGGPWSFFRRMRCLCGGEIIDDIDYYNRVHEMLHICTSNANRENDDIEGFGWRWDSRDTHASGIGDAAAGIASGSRACASFKPLSGLLCGNSKYIPLMYAPLTFEFETGQQLLRL